MLAFVVEWCGDAGFVVAGKRKYFVEHAGKRNVTVVVELWGDERKMCNDSILRHFRTSYL